jgi:hypothetical protein
MDFLRRLSDACRMGEARSMTIREVMRAGDKTGITNRIKNK